MNIELDTDNVPNLTGSLLAWLGAQDYFVEVTTENRGALCGYLDGWHDPSPQEDQICGWLYLKTVSDGKQIRIAGVDIKKISI